MSAKDAYDKLETLAATLARDNGAKGEDISAYRFDVFAAAYAWCSLNHSGQFSDTYELLCRIDFEPGANWSETRELDGEENSSADSVVRLLSGIFRHETTEST